MVGFEESDDSLYAIIYEYCFLCVCVSVCLRLRLTVRKMSIQTRMVQPVLHGLFYHLYKKILIDREDAV